MKIKDLLYETPEMTEEKLLKLIEEDLDSLKAVNKSIIKRIKEIYKYSDDISKLILKEFDNIQEKKSLLTKSQRDTIIGFVGSQLIKMTKKEDISKEEYTEFEEVENGTSGE